MLPTSDENKKEGLGKRLAQIVVNAATIAITAILIMLIFAVVATVFKGLFWYVTFLFF